MRVRCTSTSPRDLGLPARGLYYTSGTEFHVVLDRQYVVMAMGVFKGTLVVLLEDETKRPNWLPVGLFEFAEARIPGTWMFRLIDPRAASSALASEGWVALWGYPELVLNPQHLDDLIEREPAAMMLFVRELANAREEDGPPG